MKAFVDKDTCIGCELCVGTCPEVFSMDKEGKSQAITSEIPNNAQNSAMEARDGCPVSAISIEE